MPFNASALPNHLLRRDSCPARGVKERKVAAEAPQGVESAHALISEVPSPLEPVATSGASAQHARVSSISGSA